MAYSLDESHNATNLSSGAANGRVVTEIVIHHWGIDGQTHDGVVSWFCGGGAATSAHFVASAGRASCLVSPDDIAWHAGDWAVNVRSVGIECRPEATDGDYATIAELIRWLRSLYGDLPLRPHKQYAMTDCPGRYDLARLDRLARALPAPAGAHTTKPTAITPSKETPLSAAEVTEIKNYIHALAIGGYTSGGKQHPGFAMVAEENQRRIAAVPANVWATTVARGGGKVSALQELADAKTAAQAVRAENAALRNVVEQLAKNPGAVDYGKVGDAVTKAIKDGVVTVDVTVSGAAV